MSDPLTEGIDPEKGNAGLGRDPPVWISQLWVTAW